MDLYWIPLGAGGNGFVRFNGRVYEHVKAAWERRSPLDLYHTALKATVADRHFVIENAWPSPNPDTASRGVVVEGPVFSERLGKFRAFRYEVRCWPEGAISDADEAPGGPQRLSRDMGVARGVVDLVASVPTMTWGRNELDLGEMWNSNSTISWLLARVGLDPESLEPPDGGYAPGWTSGIVAASVTGG